MINELLLFLKKHTDALNEQTKTKPQETLEVKLNKQMETFSSNTSINFFEEGNWLLAVTCFEAGNSVFNVIDENNSFSITTPARWSSEIFEEIFNQLNELSERRSENDNELHVKKVLKGGTRLLMENSGFNLAGFDQLKGQKLAGL